MLFYCKYFFNRLLGRFDTLNIKHRKSLQLKTSTYLIMALNNYEYKDSTVVPTINYLIGEMFRRTSQFDKVIDYYDKAINDPNKQDWLKEVAIEQKELAIKKNDDNSI